VARRPRAARRPAAARRRARPARSPATARGLLRSGGRGRGRIRARRGRRCFDPDDREIARASSTTRRGSRAHPAPAVIRDRGGPGLRRRAPSSSIATTWSCSADGRRHHPGAMPRAAVTRVSLALNPGYAFRHTQPRPYPAPGIPSPGVRGVVSRRWTPTDPRTRGASPALHPAVEAVAPGLGCTCRCRSSSVSARRYTSRLNSITVSSGTQYSCHRHAVELGVVARTQRHVTVAPTSRSRYADLFLPAGSAAPLASYPVLRHLVTQPVRVRPRSGRAGVRADFLVQLRYIACSGVSPGLMPPNCCGIATSVSRTLFPQQKPDSWC